jgi:hypothetical protein
MFAAADTAIRMLYVKMDIRCPSLNFMADVSLSVISVVRTVGSAVGVAMAATE